MIKKMAAFKEQAAKQNKLLSGACVLLSIFVSILLSPRAWSFDFQAGVAMGYGAAGIQQAQTISGTGIDVQRSDGPVMMDLFVEKPLSDRLSVGLEDEFGFQLGPFSAGTHFIGITGRYFYLGPMPEKVKAPDVGEATLLVKHFAPFVGAATGLATASITRPNDLVQNVTGSGVYMGIKLGADYQINGSMAIRPEIIYSYTFMSQETPTSVLSAFAVQCGIYFFL